MHYNWTVKRMAKQFAIEREAKKAEHDAFLIKQNIEWQIFFAQWNEEVRIEREKRANSTKNN